MGKGLSPLQKKILLLANGKEKNSLNDVQLYTCDIKVSIFGLKSDEMEESIKNNWCYTGHHLFSKKEIGEKKYASICSTISRCITRLQKRGLINAYSGVNSHWTGISLTKKGIEACKNITVNSLVNLPKS